MSERSEIIENRRGQIGRWVGLGAAIGVLVFVFALLSGVEDISPFFSAIGSVVSAVRDSSYATVS